MQQQASASLTFRVRAARPTDVPALMRFKRLLAESENGLHTVRATAADWLRDAFGAQPGFTALVVEAEYSRGLVGMATFSQRIITGWSGPVIFLQDLFVEPAYRRNGIARALLARVAAHAHDIGSPMIELSVRADNPAQLLYQQSGFLVLPPCPTYVLAGPALAALAAGDEDALPLAG
ncbi:MAG: GNAT family N-acetyltransferase [Xanthobacteraceae bacterium]